MLRIGLGLFLAAWFIYFSRGVWKVHFSPDDMMNIDNFYWTPGPWRLVYSQFLIWRGYYRPLGGLFYLPILRIWGLNPAPYHVGLSLLLAGGVVLIYRLMRLLGSDRAAAWLCALAACYHAGLGNLYYNTAFVYDALCGLFYFAAVGYYASVRRTGKLLTPAQKLVFAGLFVCALNSKEMALTLPAVLLAYEWVYHSRKPPKEAPARRPAPEAENPHEAQNLPPTVGNDARGARARAWLTGQGSVALLASGLALLDLYGKIFGHDALTGMEGYRPVFSWQRFVDYQRTFLHDAVFWNADGAALVSFWLVISYLAWRPAARPILRFWWFFLALTPLPLEFLPGKSQACLYIPMVGLAGFASVICADLAGALAERLTREPLIGQLGRPALTAVLILGVVYYWGRENLRQQHREVQPVMNALGAQTWQVIEQFRALDPHVRSRSHVLFLNDPFQEWDMLFIADLWFRDRTIVVRLQQKTPVPAASFSQFDRIFDYEHQQLIQVR